MKIDKVILVFIIFISLIVFLIFVEITLSKAQDVRDDMIFILEHNPSCGGYLHLLGMEGNFWYKLGNKFIFSKGSQNNIMIMVEEGCPDDAPLYFPPNETDPFYSLNKEDILNNVKYYQKLYNKFQK